MPRGYCNSPAHLRDKIINYQPQDRLLRPEITRRGSAGPKITSEPQFLRGVDSPQVRGGRGEDGYSTLGFLADITILSAAIIASKLLFDVEVGNYVPQEVSGDFVKSWLVPGLLGLVPGAVVIGARNLLFRGSEKPAPAPGTSEVLTTAMERTQFSMVPPSPSSGSAPPPAKPTAITGETPKVLVIPAGIQARPVGSSTETSPLGTSVDVKIGTEVYGGSVVTVEDQEVEAARFTAALANQLGGRFKIGGLIGKGSFGQVFEATQIIMERTVALKVTDLSKLDDPSRSLREIQILAKLDDHPHIMRVFDGQLININGNKYLVMSCEYLKGKDMEEEIREKKTLPEQEALRIVYEATQALYEAFKRGVIHRDIKPANLFILEGSRSVKVLDFGMAKKIFEGAAHMTHDGKVVGTPHYMAPELFLEGFPRDHHMDIYALGVVLFKALTGRPPFEGDSSNPGAVIIKAVKEIAPRAKTLNPKITREAQALLDRMLEKDPRKRTDYPELIAALENLLKK